MAQSKITTGNLNTDTQQRINQAIGLVDSTIWVITAQHEQQAGGMIATFVTSVSIVPDCRRFLIAIAKQHATSALIASSGRCGLHVIDESQHGWVFDLGGRSGHEATGEKLARYKTHTQATGTKLLTEALAGFDCRVEQTFDSGDRMLVLLAVADAFVRSTPAKPLTFHRMWTLIDSAQREHLTQRLIADQALDREQILRFRDQPTS